MNNLLPGEYDVQRWGRARECCKANQDVYLRKEPFFGLFIFIFLLYYLSVYFYCIFCRYSVIRHLVVFLFFLPIFFLLVPRALYQCLFFLNNFFIFRFRILYLGHFSLISFEIKAHVMTLCWS